MGKQTRGHGWCGVILALVCVALFYAGDRDVFAQGNGTAQEEGAVRLLQMDGYALELWNVPSRIQAVADAPAYQLPVEGSQAVGVLENGAQANAWGRTSNGWYLMDCNGTLGYVHYTKAGLISPQDAAVVGQTVEQTAQQAALQAAELAAQQAAELAAQQAAADQAAQQAALQQIQAAQVVLIGDSRTVYLQDALEEAYGFCPVTVVAQSGAREEWLESTGIPRADPVVGQGTKVILNMGVNDLNHVAAYQQLVNAAAAIWISRGAQVYYASVNPVWDNYLGITQERVDLFNRELRAGLLPQISWIDSAGYLLQTGFQSNDGIHYNPGTSLKIFQYYMAAIGV